MTQLMRQNASARVVAATGNLSQMWVVLNEDGIGHHRDAVTRERSDEIDVDSAFVVVNRRSNWSEIR